MDIHFLSVDFVIQIHKDQTENYGGTGEILDFGLLESAVSAARSGIGGQYFHKDVYAMAAAYFYHINMNHAFRDGNKRTGAVAALEFLRANGLRVQPKPDEFEQLSMAVAEGRADKEEVAEFLRANARQKEG